MPKTVPVMTRVSPTLKKKLQALAKDTKRSESYLVAEAIADYLDLNAWQIKVIKKRVEEVLSGEPGVPHEDVVKWLDSKGTDHELPMPKPRD
ncbi:MAG: CopG family ribbon-helix-helix protein [Alphaproteobacteria bacterium]